MKSYTLLTILILLCSTLLFSVNIEPEQNSSIDSVQIGEQIWMKKNLNVSKFRNGDNIPEAQSKEEWIKASEEGKPAWCYYKNIKTNGDKYGKLYNWFAVIDERGLAPEGWHIPSDKEWTELEVYLGEDAGYKLKSTENWNEGRNGSNSSGFSGLPAGYRGLYDDFDGLGDTGYWWSSTDFLGEPGWHRNLSLFKKGILRALSDKGDGWSVRCVKN
tara:strand:+ start:18020 stop:18667 length:648 start_codon:yes stop_codon:yes gene_type:complete